MRKIETILAFMLSILVLSAGAFIIPENNSHLFFRLLAGVALGYALSRGNVGFAGSIKSSLSIRLYQAHAVFGIVIFSNSNRKHIRTIQC